MAIEAPSAVVGLVAGYLCLKLARSAALGLLVIVLALFALKHYGWVDEDFSSWRRHYDEASERVQSSSYWNRLVDYLEGSSKWLQRGFLAGIWLALLV